MLQPRYGQVSPCAMCSTADRDRFHGHTTWYVSPFDCGVELVPVVSTRRRRFGAGEAIPDGVLAAVRSMGIATGATFQAMDGRRHYRAYEDHLVVCRER